MLSVVSVGGEPQLSILDFQSNTIISGSTTTGVAGLNCPLAHSTNKSMLGIQMVFASTSTNASTPTFTVDGSSATNAFYIGGQIGGVGKYMYAGVWYYDSSSEDSNVLIQSSSLTDYIGYQLGAVVIGCAETIGYESSQTDNDSGPVHIGVDFNAVSANKVFVGAGVAGYTTTGYNTSSYYDEGVTASMNVSLNNASNQYSGRGGAGYKLLSSADSDFAPTLSLVGPAGDGWGGGSLFGVA